MGFTYAVDELNNYIGSFVAGEFLLLNFLRYLVNGFLIYGPFALSF